MNKGMWRGVHCAKRKIPIRSVIFYMFRGLARGFKGSLLGRGNYTRSMQSPDLACDRSFVI
jgi:hypothetical protein